MTNAATELAATRKIPVVLTVKDAVHKIKEDCPGTAVTEHYLRQLIRDGVLPNLRASNKQLINLDVLIEYLTNPDSLSSFSIDSGNSSNLLLGLPLVLIGLPVSSFFILRFRLVIQSCICFAVYPNFSPIS